MNYNHRKWLLRWGYIALIINLIVIIFCVLACVYYWNTDSGLSITEKISICTSTVAFTLSFTVYNTNSMIGYDYKKMIDELDTLLSHHFISEYEYKEQIINLRKEFQKNKSRLLLKGK